MTTTSGTGTRNGAGAGERGSGPGRAPALTRFRRATAGAVGVLLVVGASTIGLHEWADAQLDGQAAHAPFVDGGGADA